MPATISPLKESEETAQQTPFSLRLPLDPLLVMAVVGLGACSLMTLAAATKHNITGDPHYFVYRQLAYLLVGLGLMAVVSRLDYGRLAQLRRGIYALLLVLVLGVIGLGSSANGSTRAISLPGFSLQSSEIGKVLLIVFLAAFLVERSRRLHDRETTVRMMALALVPTLLVFVEPDVGSGLVYMAIALTALFVAGVPWRHLAALVALGVLALVAVLVLAPIMGVHVLQHYQLERLTAFLNPSAKGTTHYQLVQSEIAIGAGRQTGMGHLGAAASSFVPFDETDFIFAAVGEQHGFVGAALVLSLYALLIWRTLRILTISKDLFGSLIAGGIAAMLMFQVFVNVGMAVGIMPITGVTLPLMSYGGSSVLSTMLAVGLLQSIYVQARSTEALKGRVLRY